MTDFKKQAAELVAQMTIEEQALVLLGDGWWRTHGVERLGLAPINVSDGPHGLRKVESGYGDAVPATCFPTAPALAASWNTALVREVGAALGRECQAADVQVILGPGINIKRSPLGGRNFEYFSEDPLLTGRIAEAYIAGVQGEGVGTSLKHFAVNSQETRRMSTSSEIDARTLHEVYLPAFEMAVSRPGEEQPWSVMSSYNPVNGTHASEHHGLLTDILREQWGFEGFVVSDWGGTHERVAGVAAGNNLEMPGSGDYNRKKIIAAVEAGSLAREVLAQSATELVAVMLKAHAARKPGGFDAEAHHALARRAGAEGIVLLKNEGQVLPLKAGARIALVGAFAKVPRYQGAGSSQVNPIRVTNAADELAALLGAEHLLLAQGCDEEGETSDALLAEAAAQAAAAPVAVVFAGLPDSYESEGFDRASLALPPGHVRMIEAVAAAQPNTVVVLLNGSAVEMPWLDKVKGLVEAWLGGQAGGGAIADVLTGRANPSGKLAETFPVALEQTPPFPGFPSRNGLAFYGEGVFVGYRHYDKRGLAPLFPFGFGLSYTRFEYTGIRVASSFDADEAAAALAVEVSVKNVGAVEGQEIVQLYVHEREPAAPGPVNELRAFDKVRLAPGEQKTVRLTLTRRDFAHYDARAAAWVVKPGNFDLRVGGSSRELPLSAAVEVRTAPLVGPLTSASLVEDFRGQPAIYEELVRALGMGALLEPMPEGLTPEQESALRKTRMSTWVFVNEMPIDKIPAFSHGAFTEQRIDEILKAQKQ
ncbi:glycoside hydrolase family 3 C-terminal domain-containing protein [Paucibacter sp. R3-3]|uniref:Glycoside hydrolase family 3 C-terminal domain-containing protein n=1 Tax=Roseateles agri TaxID=3098619 RepID=A0ABU5DQ27_9BURK|nr:glycoside hydrolase family 3 C-terminal domain-containing protein [Paucibacter sp. R3-3]MDY0748209.1 glycoside hydrolase family 3 C-terminal domain-containing protein [Paucibacter sp. R3-3]